MVVFVQVASLSAPIIVNTYMFTYLLAYLLTYLLCLFL